MINNNNDELCPDCNKCARPSNDTEESHICSLCKEYVIDADSVKLRDSIEIMSK